MVKEMHYQENTLFDLDPKVMEVKVTQNVAHYPQLYVTYAPANFDVAIVRPVKRDWAVLSKDTPLAISI